MKNRIMFIASIIAVIGFPVFAEKAQVKEYTYGMITFAECNNIFVNGIASNVKKGEMISISACKKQSYTK